MNTLFLHKKNLHKKNIISWVLRSKMSVSWEKVRLVGQFEILAQDNFFSSKVRPEGQFILRSCPTDGFRRNLIF